MGISKAASYEMRMYAVSGRKYARAECVSILLLTNTVPILGLISC